ncbi:leucine--tRNA ligase [Mycoplasma bradburyae]|uniref:leucine--tRNA ligase n=1 Tax=Mycoplasma bradburyae TaxID=2963128 RepID=UPI0020CDC5A5|nr:leucine--tRNA ligase [Mycoplasma bradburyae]UTS71141.1 leucine--tRNA ligase [Mycoplasma bradburyae]
MYNHNLIENKWRKVWSDQNVYHFDLDKSKTKYYILDMFPYPSGKGLHVGHVKAFMATDVVSRWKNALGFNVLHPIGWDAFGLPAEQYAIQTNNHPAKFTQENIDNFRNQLQSLGFNYDYRLEVDTTNPNYFQWTQWIFKKLYEHNLAYQADIEVNWCEKLGTVLANEEVLTDEAGNKISERGSYPVIKKKMRQWVLKITEFADELIKDLDDINWPNSIKAMQVNWIGKSTGASIKFDVEGLDNQKIEVFSSRADTLFGVSFIALSFDHELVKQKLITNKNDQIEEFIKANSIDQTVRYVGIDTNYFAIHPITKKRIPIYLADYIISDYGTGAVMGVAAHDERDYNFANKYNLEIIPVIKADSYPYLGDGSHINSDFINGLDNDQAINKIIDYLEKNNIGSKKTNYKLRDWIFSRQRYWGEPFPVVFDENNNCHLLKDEQLPLKLPELKDFSPNKQGLPPLANASDEWLHPIIDKKKYTREINTMPQWAGSCWYFLGYILKLHELNKNHLDQNYLALNSPEAKALFDHFMPVDLYVGGQEHAVLHLLYARFWYKFLYKINVVSSKEPFYQLMNQGMILGEDGTKMSKSKGNIINPDDLVLSHGADTIRTYVMFMGPLNASLAWNSNALNGTRKFLERVYNLFDKITINDDPSEHLNYDYHNFLKKVNQHLENYEFNLVVSEMMIFINACYKQEQINKEMIKNFLIVLSFFAPFLAEELNEKINNKQLLYTMKLAKWDEQYLVKNVVTISCSINGKYKMVNDFNIDASEQEVADFFLNQETIKKQTQDKQIVKTIFVKNKIINFIVK